MTHYQKLATMIFRIIRMVFLVFALISFLAGFIFVTLGFFTKGGLPIAFSLIIYAVVTSVIGEVFFQLSKKLANRVCSDFNE